VARHNQVEKFFGTVLAAGIFTAAACGILSTIGLPTVNEYRLAEVTFWAIVGCAVAGFALTVKLMWKV
jgi:hypothetical protein